jgi:uncharacterized protein YggE
MQSPYGTRYGYVVTRTVTVTSDHADRAGAIVDAAVAAGVTTIGGLAFGLRDTSAVYRSALAAAVADAQAQAQVLVTAAHARILGLIDIGATSYQPVVPLIVRSPMASGGVMSRAGSFVPPNDLTVTATVTLSYELAP